MARRKLELKTELAYFIKIKDGLLPENEGKFVLIKNKTLVGLYKTPKGAYQKGLKRFGETQFLIKEVTKDENTESIKSKFSTLVGKYKVKKPIPAENIRKIIAYT